MVKRLTWVTLSLNAVIPGLTRNLTNHIYYFIGNKEKQLAILWSAAFFVIPDFDEAQ